MLLVLLAVFRVSAWIATLIGSIVTFLLGVWVWRMPFGDGARAYLYGSATGIWAVDWITIWGVILFNTLVVTGVLETFRRWLIAQGTADVRVLQDRILVHHCGAHPWLDWRCTLRQQHLNKRHVRRIPSGGREIARLPAISFTDPELGGSGGRQASGSANCKCRRIDEPIRTK
jgi:L-lactate permease